MQVIDLGDGVQVMSVSKPIPEDGSSLKECRVAADNVSRPWDFGTSQLKFCAGDRCRTHDGERESWAFKGTILCG